jgi:hypothetical protein
MSDRYQFLKDYTDPLNTSKVFKMGCVARMSSGDGDALIANGTVKRVADFTPQRMNVLASGGCTQLDGNQIAQIETAAFVAGNSDEAQDEAQTNSNNNKKNK